MSKYHLKNKNKIFQKCHVSLILTGVCRPNIDKQISETSWIWGFLQLPYDVLWEKLEQTCGGNFVTTEACTSLADGHSVAIEACTSLVLVCLVWRSGSPLELSALWYTLPKKMMWVYLLISNGLSHTELFWFSLVPVSFILQVHRIIDGSGSSPLSRLQPIIALCSQCLT